MYLLPPCLPFAQLLDIGAIAAAGDRCIDKIVVVEETERDERVECHHRFLNISWPLDISA